MLIELVKWYLALVSKFLNFMDMSDGNILIGLEESVFIKP
jgi:hypothetical protein